MLYLVHGVPPSRCWCDGLFLLRRFAAPALYSWAGRRLRLALAVGRLALALCLWALGGSKGWLLRRLQLLLLLGAASSIHGHGA